MMMMTMMMMTTQTTIVSQVVALSTAHGAIGLCVGKKAFSALSVSNTQFFDCLID